MYERFKKEKIDLALKFVEFTKKQERSQIKPQGSKDPRVAKHAGNGNVVGMMDTIMTQTYYILWLLKMAQISNRTTTSFLDFSHLEQAQAIHEHTEQPTTQLGSISFVDAIKLYYKRCLAEVYIEFEQS